MRSDVLVIGAGPAGLAAAAELGRRGISATVLDQSDQLGWSWTERYDGLRLHTVRWMSGLPGAAVPRRYGRWVSRDDYARYLRYYANRFQLRVESGVRVLRVDRSPTGWTLVTSAGPREATAVVVATGNSRRPEIPDWPGLADYRRPVLHSADYREATAIAGQTVLVVGAGNSATEIAAELADVGAAVQLSVRTPPAIVRRTVLGVPVQLLGLVVDKLPERVAPRLTGLLRRLAIPDLTRFGLTAPVDNGFEHFRREHRVPIIDHGFVRLVQQRRITVVPAVDRFTPDRVVLVDGSSVDPDLVIAATGFRPELTELVGHLEVLDEQGAPLVAGAATVASAPHLHFVGYRVVLAGLLREIGREATAVAAALSEADLAPQAD